MVGIQLGKVARLCTNSWMTSSTVGILWWSWQMTSLRSCRDLSTGIACHLPSGCRWLRIPSPCRFIYLGDHSQAFHLVEVLLDLWHARQWGISWGCVLHGMNIMTELDCIFARESTNSCELIWKLLHQVISGSDGLGCCMGCSRLGHCCCGSRCRAWSFCAGLDDCDGTIYLHNC